MKLLKKFNSLEKYTKLAIIVILLGIIIRFSLAAIYHVSGDACWHLSVARFIGENYTIPLFEDLGRDSVFSRPPLFHIIGAIFYNVFGIFGLKAANFSLKMISPIFGSLTLILLYKFVRKYYTNKLAFISVAVLTFLPVHIYYSTISYIESTVAFFALLSVFLIMENRLVLAAITTGMTALLKYEGLFMIPVILAIIYYKSKFNLKKFLKKGLLFAAISSLVYLPLLIRNYIYLKNPFWPYFTQIIGGYPVSEGGYLTSNIANLFDISIVTATFLEFFGVPNGNPDLLHFINIPFIDVLIILWFAATLFFSFFFVYGLIKAKKQNPKNKTLIIWLGVLFILILITKILHYAPFVRYLFAALPAIAIIWAIGINEALKIKKFKKIFLSLIIIIILGFVSIEITKTVVAARTWAPYEEDFEWIKANTGKESTIFYLGQCLSYNSERFTTYPLIPFSKEFTIPEKSAKLGESYIWTNQNFNPEPESILPKGIIETIENSYELIYYNQQTQTKLYKIQD